jgi:hypothetical protein
VPIRVVLNQTHADPSPVPHDFARLGLALTTSRGGNAADERRSCKHRARCSSCRPERFDTCHGRNVHRSASWNVGCRRSLRTMRIHPLSCPFSAFVVAILHCNLPHCLCLPASDCRFRCKTCSVGLLVLQCTIVLQTLHKG